MLLRCWIWRLSQEAYSLYQPFVMPVGKLYVFTALTKRTDVQESQVQLLKAAN